MEIYGYNYAVNYFEPSVTPLISQRRKVQKDLNLLKIRLTEQMSKLEDHCANPQKSFGRIYSDLSQLAEILTKVTNYYQAKKDPFNSSARSDHYQPEAA